ncbi:hypothetical protein LLH06_11600 [Mucilaginibacter daejeonensis]|uniref:hypothetical protein n=1 Tax=Mucilaginibacter daejeonensis TaxID=398049 RepID=UPI001D17D3E3|nr:hypothetical protein [Mucilaginibacter daejeonensis]UEG51615.1 hypothetical protein LLH06_11600 [Mucilaginibacter daejeonensis]
MLKPFTILATAMLLVCGIAAHAQDTATVHVDTSSTPKFQDIIVTSAGDTIPCETRHPFMGVMRYRTADMPEFKKIDIKGIKYYTFQNKEIRFKAALLPKKSKPTFLRLVEEGKITLYLHEVYHYIYMGASYTTTTWYATKGDDVLKEIKTTGISGKSRKERQAVFADMLADQPIVLKLYEDADSFTFSTLRGIVNLYNSGRAIARQ